MRFIFLIPVILGYALPHQPTVVEGEAHLLHSPELLEIVVSDRSILEWTQFNIEPSEITRFIQPNQKSSVINRVYDSTPSRLMGRLESNGQVILINPNGILVGKEAMIDVGSLIASTLDCKSFEEFSGSSKESIVNAGTINAQGDVFLIASRVQNEGSIETKGRAGLIGNVFFKPEGLDRIYVRGNSFSDAFVCEATQRGSIRANEVYTLGERVHLNESSRIDAPSGIVSIEGKWTQIEKGAVIDAGGQGSSKGGTVLVWGDEATSFHGHISVRSEATDGGFIEVSSPKYLEYRGTVDASAPLGKIGTLLLDPTDVTIDGAGPTSGWNATCPTGFIGNPGAVVILNTDLQNALASCNVTIDTNGSTAGSVGDITISAPITWGAGTSLTLIATNDINLDDLISPMGAFAGDQVVLTAGGILTARKTNFGPGTVGVQTQSGGINLSGSQIMIGNPLATGDTRIETLISGAITMNATSLIQPDAPVPFVTPPPPPPGANYALTLQASSTTSGALAQIKSFGPMTITAGSMILIGGDTTDNNFAYVFCDSDVQRIDVTGLLTLYGGSGANVMPGVRKTEVGTIESTASPTQIISAGNIYVLGGAGTEGVTVIRAEGVQTVTTTGNLTLVAGSGTDAQADIIEASASAILQTVSANNIFLFGNNLTDCTASITNTNGSQTISALNQIILQGGVGRADFDCSTTQVVNANELLLIGGSGANTGFAAITSNLGQTISVLDDLVMTADLGETVISGGNNGATQTVSASSISLFASASADSIIVAPGGDQTINCLGPIYLESILSFMQRSEITFSTTQTINADSIHMFGETLIGMDPLFGMPPGIQTFHVAADFLLQGFADGTGQYTAQVAPDNSSTQHCFVGGDLTLDGNFGVADFETGSFSDCSVAGNLNLIGDHGAAQMSGLTHNTIRVLGNTTVDVTTGSNVVLGSFGPAFLLQISGDLSIGSSAAVGRSAISISDDYEIDVRGSTTILGGAFAGAFSQISQPAFPGRYSPGQINIGKDLLIRGGSASTARGAIDTLGGFLDLRIGEDLSVFGGSATGADGRILSMGLRTLTISGQTVTPTGQNIFVGRNILVQGGSTSAGSARGYIEAFNGTQKVGAGGTIDILGGTNGASNHALIGAAWFNTSVVFGQSTALDTTSSEIDAYGSITLQNNSSGSKAFVDTTASGIRPNNLPVAVMTFHTGTVTVRSARDVTFSTSVHLVENVPFTVGTHPLLVQADAAFAQSQVWPGNANLFIGGTPVASPSPAINANALGGFKVDTTGTGGGISFTTTAGFNHLSSGEYFQNGSFCNLIVGPTTAINNLTMNSISGDVTIDPFHNITITNPITTAGNILVIAQNNIQMTSTSSVAAGQTVNLVVDNQRPTAPLIGPGAFIMDAGATITSGGALRIFTARQSQNTILGLLNGTAFVAGPLFANTATEHWCTYYFNPFFGGVYTVFYKDCLSSVANQANLIISENITENSDIRDDYGAWTERFCIVDGFGIEEDPLQEIYYLKRRIWPIRSVCIDTKARTWGCQGLGNQP